MTFDEEGHVRVQPREVHELAITDPIRLIHEVLIPGTPLAFSTHSDHCRFLQHFADSLNVHPRNILLRGSTKIGFSITPRSRKVWMTYGDASDIDLAIIDHGYFERLDEEVRVWERDPDNRSAMLSDARAERKALNRTMQRGQFRCLRYFDLPPVRTLVEHNRCLRMAPVLECCGIARPLTAFVFRDWWGIFDRYLFDVEELARKLGNPTFGLADGEAEPRPRTDD